MTVMIEGVSVDNPTAVWMQLKNTRQVLHDKNRWNSGGWFDRSGAAFTMCLANAVRYVSRGVKQMPTVWDRPIAGEGQDLDMEVAEALLLAFINKGRLRHEQFDDIPHFNDEQNRRHHDILGVIDAAIEAVKPHARQDAVVIAHEVMTPEERKEVDDAVWEIEGEMWAETRRRLRITQGKDGRWRDGDGRFAEVPYWVRNPAQSPAMAAFRDWLDGHQERGWGTFWDELLECDEHDQECQERQERQAALV